MTTGYTRADISNNISDGNIINAADLDLEFDALQTAFNAVNGHSHDGTLGEGAPILVVGPAQDVVITTSTVQPKTDNTVDLGTSTFEFKDLWIDGTANIDSLVADTADINAGTIDGVVIGGATPAAGTFTTLAATSFTVGGSAVVTPSGTQTLTNKTISVDDNTVSGIAASSFVLSNASGHIDGAVAQKAIPSGAVVGTTDAQTLTNKTISGATNTLSNISLATSVTATLAVANGGTGRSTLTNGAIILGAGTSQVGQLVGSSVGQVPQWDGSTWTVASLPSGGVTNVTASSPLASSGGSTPNISFTGTLAVANGGTGATTLTGVVIGNGTSAFTVKTNPSGAFVGTTDAQTLTNKTLTDPAIVGTILEDVFTITDGAAFEIDPGNGSIQLITLGASRTPKATNFVAGEAVTLMVDDGSAFTLTWTDATFGGSGVVWKTDSGVAPTLNTTGYTVIVLWKVGTQVYGARVGDS